MATDNKNISGNMSVEDVISIIKAVSDSDLENFEFSQGDTRLSLSGRKSASAVYVNAADLADSPICVSAPAVAQSAAAGVQQAAEAAPAEEEKKENIQEIVSPLVGVFYRAPAAGEKPFVSIGDKVKKGQVLGIIEAMKMMNEIESDFDGVVEEILVENEGKVEYGQVLFRISK